jgi:hypothetical protein
MFATTHMHLPSLPLHHRMGVLQPTHATARRAEEGRTLYMHAGAATGMSMRFLLPPCYSSKLYSSSSSSSRTPVPPPIQQRPYHWALHPPTTPTASSNLRSTNPNRSQSRRAAGHYRCPWPMDPCHPASAGPRILRALRRSRRNDPS